MGFELPRLTKCCFCVPLRLATLIIGYFAIVSSLATLAALSFYTYKVAAFVRDSGSRPNPQHSPEEIRQAAIALYVSFAFDMLVFLYNLVIHVLLVVGVHKNKPQYLKLYIQTGYFLLGLSVVMIALTCVFMGIWATIPALKWAFVLLMCIIVVRSMYLDMIDEQTKPRVIEMQNLYMPPHARAPLMA